jgi:2-polyprenyl-3-methyl-5-hydroxy-6-metoxy-1,4-benzoquinol methylase
MLIPIRYGENNKLILTELSKIFEKIYKRPHKWRKFQHYSNEYPWAINELTKYLGDIKDKEMMEGGGGQGGTLYYFANRNAKVTNLSHGGAAPNKNLVHIQGDMAVRNLGSNKFDSILCLSSIEHNEWDKIKKIFLNLVDMAKPGAPLVFTVPVGKIRKWYPQNSFINGNFPSLYLFNPEAVKELDSLTKDVELVTKIVPNYDQLWDTMIKEVLKTPGASKWKYLSGGFTFIKK